MANLTAHEPDLTKETISSTETISSPPQKPSQIKIWWRGFARLISASWYGAVFGAGTAFVVCIASLGLGLDFGFGPVVGVLLMGILGALMLSLTRLLASLVSLILQLLTKLGGKILKGWLHEKAQKPYRAVKAVPDRVWKGIGGVVGVVAIQSFLLPMPKIVVNLTWMVIALEAVTGALIGLAFSKKLTLKKPALISLVSLAVALNAGALIWLLYPGYDDYLVKDPAAPALPQIALANPGEPGPYKVETLSYGSGTDKQRAEYRTGVALKTDPVDASPLLPQWDGLMQNLRTFAWGFDAKALPLNGRVWYPVGEGPFPLVLVVHGNHAMLDFSDPGYAYLGELLASRGFITVSVDENFLNGTLFVDFEHKENATRAWLLLQHLKAWQNWSQNEGNPFYHKVDMTNLGLIGHSRGGEAVELAASFSKLSRGLNLPSRMLEGINFPIKAVVAIAPSDYYEINKKPVALENSNYLVLQGGHDADVTTFMGIKAYQRTTFTDENYHFKAALYSYRANHGQFNTTWGSTDDTPPLSVGLNMKPLLKSQEQEQLGKVYISAFLEASLHNQTGYLPLFREPRSGQSWLPNDLYVSQFEDSNFKPVSTFEPGSDSRAIQGFARPDNLKDFVISSLVYRNPQKSLQQNQAAFITWEQSGKTPSYTFTLNDEVIQKWALKADSRLAFALSRAGAKASPLDFSVELTSRNGQKVSLPLSQFAAIHPPLVAHSEKIDWLKSDQLGNPVEQVLQNYELPLAAFVQANPQFNPAEISQMRFVFDRAPSGEVILDNIGFYK